jgi:hypothetical protein
VIGILICPECHYADDVSLERLTSGLVRYTCTARHGDGQNFIWEITADQASGGGTSGSAGAGVTADLFDPMLACVVAGGPFVEYGIVEYRLSQQYPELYRAHIAERGHVMLAPSRVTASNSRFGPTLVRLAANGLLTRIFETATGAWRYNGRTTYWARPGTPANKAVTWEQYCADHGRSSEWTPEDRATATVSS